MGRGKKFSEDKIVRMLREAEASELTVVEFCRGKGISEQTFYRWKKKFAGMSEKEALRLKKLEVENMRLKKMLAERDLEIDILKEIQAKKW